MRTVVSVVMIAGVVSLIAAYPGVSSASVAGPEPVPMASCGHMLNMGDMDAGKTDQGAGGHNGQCGGAMKCCPGHWSPCISPEVNEIEPEYKPVSLNRNRFHQKSSHDRGLDRPPRFIS